MMSVTPYLRIAESLRRRIESGQLAPGARVPSTRALAKRHGVALATAAHALSHLAAEGLVRAVPRVGNVVTARASRRPAEGSVDLSQVAIVRAAVAIADAEGLAALSLRGVAARLGAPVTSLYRHVDGKEALLRAMANAALGETELPASPPGGWRARLELAARAHFALLRRHPWLGRLLHVTRPRPLPNAIAYASFVLGALEETRLPAVERMKLHVALHTFVQGVATNLEAEAEAVGESGVDGETWMQGEMRAFDELAASGRYPAFERALDELDDGFDLDLGEIFELGLQSLLDGFERVVRRRSGPARPG